MRIADVHAHIFPDQIADKVSTFLEDYYKVHSAYIPQLTTLLKAEAQAGVSYMVGCSAATKPSQVQHLNDFVSYCAQKAPNMIPFGSLFPTMEHWEPELERMQELGIRGVKIHSEFQHVPLDEPTAIPMYQGIAKAGLPVLVHMGDTVSDFSAPKRLLNLLRQVPDLLVIAAHFGGWSMWEASAETKMPENVYYDTSSSLMYLGKDRGQNYLEKLGPERFLFGTDFPMWSPEKELARFLELDLDEATRDRILFGNFEALFLK